MTKGEREEIKERIRAYQAMIDNDPNGKEADNWRQIVKNLKAML